ncbi:aminodeoxychorismate/anthranilate synthase component II [Atopobacter sp. AH10]|uniref:anthranilate synthase component II n=1 Tax=Atopobacter sp. AH10 TaxID=2315861 RepID=UPI000EF26207|nr:aminodeoxychorismate/anthranilate synthase component II [Atopobacter sp. AH10]RLK63936.1 aminodeoxychorismate/anthranilate synthase component II [Atopobacter sp. AH10]
MILMIDNYDSFAYNLYQLIGKYENDIKVIRNDELTLEEVEKLHPDKIIISPGPGKCEDAGIIVDLIKTLGYQIPILGVCLGHQAICQAFGGEITYAKRLMHGKVSTIKIDKQATLFKGLPSEIKVARYHSLAADRKSLPSELRVIASAEDGEIMAVEHNSLPIYGLQFHPESIMTPCGEEIIQNFLGKMPE